MANPKDPTWEEHKNAERQVCKRIDGRNRKARYADFLHALHTQYHLLESFAKVHNLLDVEIAPKHLRFS